MATKSATPARVLPGEDPGTISANQRYQEALDALTNSLDNRKRLFDPTMLAFAQGMLAPTQTGGFGEALGNAAKSMGVAQESEDKRNKEDLQTRLAVANQAAEYQRSKSDVAAGQEWLKTQGNPIAGPGAAAVAGPLSKPMPAEEGPAVPPAPPGGALSRLEAPTPAGPPGLPTGPSLGQARPVGPAATQGALTQAVEKPPGFENTQGIPIMPPNPSITTKQEHVARNLGRKPLAELMKEGEEMERHRWQKTETGMVDLRTGLEFPKASAERIDMPIFGEGYGGKSYNISKSDAMRLARLQSEGDEAAYTALANRATGKTFGKSTAGKSEVPASVEERTLEKKEAESRAGKMGEKSAEKEASIEDMDATARRIYGSTTRVADYLKQSPSYFGIFARPGVTSAIGNLVKEGIQTPSGTLNLAGFEDSMRKMMPGVTQKDLDNVTKAATELAEIELAFTRLYLAKQGAVTEGERKIVRAIPGTTSSSPEVLKTRMNLLKARSQFDIDVADSFRQWQENNPGRSYYEFERKSSLYKDIKKNFEAETERLFGGIKAVPTRQRKEEARGGKDLTSAKQRVDDLLKD